VSIPKRIFLLKSNKYKENGRTAIFRSGVEIKNGAGMVINRYCKSFSSETAVSLSSGLPPEGPGQRMES
jgi:hypothetical protein